MLALSSLWFGAHAAPTPFEGAAENTSVLLLGGSRVMPPARSASGSREVVLELGAPLEEVRAHPLYNRAMSTPSTCTEAGVYMS